MKLANNLHAEVAATVKGLGPVAAVHAAVKAHGAGATRAELVTALVVAGINPATAQTQVRQACLLYGVTPKPTVRAGAVPSAQKAALLAASIARHKAALAKLESKLGGKA